jgi:hypothetical protein
MPPLLTFRSISPPPTNASNKTLYISFADANHPTEVSPLSFMNSLKAPAARLFGALRNEA